MNEIIKKILKDDSEKLIIMDNGKPKFVVMSYNNYLKLSGEGKGEENFEINFQELFKSGENRNLELTPRNDEKLQEQKKDLSLDDLPIIQ